MKKELLIIFLIALLFPFSVTAAQEPSKGQAVVKMTGYIDPDDLTIIVTDEQGNSLSTDNPSLRFDFPAEESWVVSQSVLFSYSSNMMNTRRGRLSFQLDTMSGGDAHQLAVSFELASADCHNVRIENGDTFVMTFLPGQQRERAIGSLTIRISKQAEDIFSAGTYSGAFSLIYIEEG